MSKRKQTEPAGPLERQRQQDVLLTHYLIRRGYLDLLPKAQRGVQQLTAEQRTTLTALMTRRLDLQRADRAWQADVQAFLADLALPVSTGELEISSIVTLLRRIGCVA
jgi:hypothetical protein